MKALAVGKHLVIDPRICLGRLSFQGTRLPVATVLAPLLEGRTVKEVLAAWPELTRPAVVEAVKLAAAAWPELLPEAAEKRIMRLAASLAKVRPDPKWEKLGVEPDQMGLFKRPVEIGQHLVIHPRICFGKMTFKGTRVPVQTVLVFMTLTGRKMKRVLTGWPGLAREGVEEAIQLAAAAWPELLQEPAGRVLRELAAELPQRNPAPRSVSSQAVAPGRTA
jgi:uncharacterized protein (DUF433 family)